MCYKVSSVVGVLSSQSCLTGDTVSCHRCIIDRKGGLTAIKDAGNRLSLSRVCDTGVILEPGLEELISLKTLSTPGGALHSISVI